MCVLQKYSRAAFSICLRKMAASQMLLLLYREREHIGAVAFVQGECLCVCVCFRNDDDDYDG